MSSTNGSGAERTVKSGDNVTVHYIGTLDNGKIFDQADEDSPLSFTLGSGEVFTAMEDEIVGMSIGEVKNIELKAEEAYGERKKENMVQVDRALFPAERKLEIADPLNIELADGSQRLMRVREVNESTVLLDGNHDLSGCDLTFALKLVDIE